MAKYGPYRDGVTDWPMGDSHPFAVVSDRFGSIAIGELTTSVADAMARC